MQMLIDGCDRETKPRMFRLLYVRNVRYVLYRHGRRLRAVTLARPATATFGNCALKTSLQLMFGSDSQTALVFVRQHLRAGERVAQCANVN